MIPSYFAGHFSPAYITPPPSMIGPGNQPQRVNLPCAPIILTGFVPTILTNDFHISQLPSASITLTAYVPLIIVSELVISPSSANITGFCEGATAFAGLQINTSGVEFRTNLPGCSASFGTSRGNWLDIGDSEDVWVERTINSGALNDLDPGAGRLQLNTTRSYRVSRPSVGTNTANVDFNYWDAASGGNLLANVTIAFLAEHDSGA